MTNAACAPENHPGVDLASIDERTPAAVVERARAVCMGCPVRTRCAPLMRRLDVAGMAGAMTRAEREAWQTQQRIAVDHVDLVDVTPARQITSQMLDALPAPDVSGELPERVRGLVLRMTQAGMSAEQIVERLAREDVTQRTVNYVRRTYMKGWARVVEVV
jgi:hypothetical protein